MSCALQQEFNVRTRLSAAARSEAEETISKRPKNLASAARERSTNRIPVKGMGTAGS
jgi:hypothetical protein